jgi:hypothetical protein
MSANSTTRFTSRGRLTGLVRRRASEDEALYYRARLILGESLPRPVAEPERRRRHGSFERKLPISDPK